MRKRLLLLCPLLALAAAAPATGPSTRPTVFRCVLDGNARMIVVSLGDDVYAAYDANRCTLAKLWRGEVILTGPVYDTRHGPQPKSAGVQLLDQPINFAPNPAPPSTRPVDYANVNGYRGYTFKDGVATIHFDFDGVKVDETPALVASSDTEIVLRRTIVVSGDVSNAKSVWIAGPESAGQGRTRIFGDASATTPLETPASTAGTADRNVRALGVIAPGTYRVETTFDAFPASTKPTTTTADGGNR